MTDTQQPVAQPLPSPSTGSKEPRDFLIQEYNALRAEILKRTEIQHQLLSLSLIASGTFLTIGFKPDGGSPTVVLAYPLVAMFLSLAWCQSDVVIRQIGTYIRMSIEEKEFPGGKGWEAHLLTLRGSGGSERSFWANPRLVAGGIFVGTQLLALLLPLFFDYSGFRNNTVLISLDVVAVLFTLFLLSLRAPLIQ